MTIKEFKDYPDTSTPINSGNLNDNFKEIKSVFNNQIAQGWYKTGINPTFTFVSYDSTTLTGVVSSNLDMTPYLNVGMKVKFTQNSAIKYAFITAITSTQLTLFLGTDYSINSSAISNTYYSMLKAPFGFPMNEDKWTLSIIDSTDIEKENPTIDTWYYSGIFLNVPIGIWKISYKASVAPISVSSGSLIQKTSLGTTTSGGIISEFTDRIYSNPSSGINVTLKADNLKIILSKTTYYLLYCTTNVTVNPILRILGGGVSPTFIKAVCAYL